MNIERFEVPGLAQYSYVVSDAGHAVVIDPIRDIDRYLDYADAQALRITHVLETHIHADFASGAIALAETTGAPTGAQLALSACDRGERFQYAMPHRALADGDAVTLGKLRLQALHTPGHTPEHLSFLLFDLSRSATEPLALFSGDFLFVGSLGRPDLLGEQAKLGLAHDLFRSVQQRIAHLPDSLLIYPGHGAGSLCGSGMSQLTASTLGYERATNPFFRYSESEFVDRILASVPPMPSYYPRLKQLNANGAPALESIPGGSALSLDQVADLAEQRRAVLLDLRRPEAFGGAHIPGAINIGAGQNLSLWAGWLLDSDRDIVLITDGPDDEDSRRALVRVGLDRILGFLDGGMPAWLAAGRPFLRLPQLSVAEVACDHSSSFILDVRSDGEWRSGFISGAHHLMLGDLPQHIDTLPRDRDILVVCGSGYRSNIAASFLAHTGFTRLSSMSGGMAAWNAQQLPLTREPAPEPVLA
jgi:hydroxyacylglutathione hydrolase